MSFRVCFVFLLVFAPFLQGSLPSFEKDDLFGCDRVGELIDGDFYARLRLLKQHLGRISQLSKEEGEKISNAIDATLFIDWEHYFPVLFEVLQGQKKLSQTRLESIYSQGDFKAHQAARRYLGNKERLLHYDLLVKLGEKFRQELPVSRGAGPAHRGAYSYFGRVLLEYPITEVQFRELESNPYVSFKVGRTVKGGMYTGSIVYPSIEYLSEEAMERLARYDRTLAERVRGVANLPSDWGPESVALSNEVLKALVNERFATFAKEMQVFPGVRDIPTLRFYVEKVSQLYRDLISIHPLDDFNGRVLRMLCLDYLMQLEGLPPARLINPDLDLLASRQAWQTQVLHGIIGSDQLITDFLSRIQFGLPLEQSPELLGPAIRRSSVAVRYSKEVISLGSTMVVSLQNNYPIDPHQFLTFFKLALEKDGRLRRKMDADPTAGVIEIGNRYEKFMQKTKRGARSALSFVDEDYARIFGVSTSQNKKKYNLKMERWFDLEQRVWRGMSIDVDDRSPSTRQILNIFRNVTDWTASPVIADSLPGASGRQLIAAAREDFSRYNRDLFDGKLLDRAQAHTNLQDWYFRSYLVSSSRIASEAVRFVNRYVVGKKFKSGGMGLLIGFRPTHHATYTSQLKAYFDYTPLEKEVFEVGAVDPDAISTILTFNRDGNVDRTFLRSNSNPNIVFEMLGESYAEDPSKVLKRHKLF